MRERIQQPSDGYQDGQLRDILTDHIYVLGLDAQLTASGDNDPYKGTTYSLLEPTEAMCRSFSKDHVHFKTIRKIEVKYNFREYQKPIDWEFTVSRPLPPQVKPKQQ